MFRRACRSSDKWAFLNAFIDAWWITLVIFLFAASLELILFLVMFQVIFCSSGAVIFSKRIYSIIPFRPNRCYHLTVSNPTTSQFFLNIIFLHSRFVSPQSSRINIFLSVRIRLHLRVCQSLRWWSWTKIVSSDKEYPLTTKPAAGGGRSTPDKTSGYDRAPGLVAFVFGNKSCPKKLSYFLRYEHLLTEN